VQNALTKHLAALALTLGLLFTGMPARAEPKCLSGIIYWFDIAFAA